MRLPTSIAIIALTCLTGCRTEPRQDDAGQHPVPALQKHEQRAHHVDRGARIPDHHDTGLAGDSRLGPAGPAGAQQPRNAGHDGRRTARALLIGISDYKSPAMQDLGGPINDIAKMEHLLVTRFGFPGENITKLIDAEATRRRILTALRKIVSETSARDVIYIHYSGHGSQVKDLNGDEDDGVDETLVPHDGRTPGVADIVDDEIDAILSQLKTDDVVIVLDSCHSGTGTRTGGGVVCQRREVKPEDERRLHLYKHLRVKRRDVVKTEEHYLLMTGAAPDQTALDGPVGGKIYGFFTYALAQALSNAKVTASAQSVFTAAAREHRLIQQRYNLVDLRAAQLEAPKNRLRRPILPPLRGAARLPWLAVKTSGKPRDLILTDGARLGAATGSQWAIYPEGETHFAPGRALAWGTVYENAGANSWLRLRWARKTRGSLDGCRAVALAPEGVDGLPVRIEGGSKADRERMQQQLRAAVSGVEFVGPNNFARFTVELKPVAHRVIGVDGLDVIQTVPASASGTRSMARLIARSVMSSELLSLQNPGTEMQIQVSVVGGRRQPPTPQRRPRGIRLVGNTGSHDYRIRRKGDPRSNKNSLVLRMRAAQDCYITIVDVDSEGGVNVLFPNGISEEHGFYPDGKLRADERVSIPDGLSDDNEAQFWFDYAEPAGLDTVRVFATSDLGTAEMIRESMRNIADAPRILGDAKTEEEDPRQELIAELKSRLNTVMSRGIKLTSNKPKKRPKRDEDGRQEFVEEEVDNENQAIADWTAASVTIRVKTK